MVGVPSSRGCTACRKQKKKCISPSGVPPCERCKRLGTTCLELGVRRLKFQSENEKLASASTSALKGSGSENKTFGSRSPISGIDGSTGANVSAGISQWHNAIPSPPSNATSRLRAGYIRIIDPSMDISVHMPWNYGPYLEHVPLYLGRNPAFDAAAETLVAGYSAMRRSLQPGQQLDCLRKYSKAVTELRQCLDCRTTATSTETLAAISMLMGFESISGFHEGSILTHAGGAAKIYKERGAVKERSQFEAMLQLSLRGAVVMQALFSPCLYFSDAEWAGLTESEVGADSAEEQSFRCLALYAMIQQQADHLFQKTTIQKDNREQLALLDVKAQALKARLTPELDSLRQTFWRLTEDLNACVENGLSADTNSWPINTYHCHIGRSYGLAMATKVLMNNLICMILSHLEEDDDGTDFQSRLHNHRELLIENQILAGEICCLGAEVDRHRPLGTIYMRSVLYLASIGVTESDTVLEWPDPIYKSPDMGRIDRIDLHGDSSQVRIVFPRQSPNILLGEIKSLLRNYMSDFGDHKPTNLGLDRAIANLRSRFSFQNLALHGNRILELYEAEKHSTRVTPSLGL